MRADRSLQYHRSMPPTGLDTVFELYDVARRMVAERYRREHAGAPESEVDEAVRTWATDHSRAPHGDSDGVPISWPRQQ